ncbi:MAG: enoyl-CoA hydratase/isomerase family protein [Bacteroidota bacterium]
MFKTIDWHIKDEIGFFQLNQPPANSMSKQFYYEIRELADTILNNLSVQAIIITGKGRHFSSGADIDDLLSFDNDNKQHSIDFYVANSQTFKRFYTAHIPVIAAIKGVCIGSAMELAMACHFRIATENIVMGFPEAGFNLMPGCGGSVYLSELTNEKNTIELLLTGRNLNSQDALDLGIVDEVVEKNELIEKAITFAKNILHSYNPSHRDFYCKRFLGKRHG